MSDILVMSMLMFLLEILDARIVADVFRDVTVKVTDDRGNVIYSRKKPKVAPGEMESVTLKPEAFAGAAELEFALEVK